MQVMVSREAPTQPPAAAFDAFRGCPCCGSPRCMGALDGRKSRGQNRHGYLMKVARRRRGLEYRDLFDAHGFHMNNVVDILDRTLKQQELALNHSGAITIEHVRRNDDVCNAGFIFKADENETFCGTRSLAGDDAAGDADKSSIGCVRKIEGAKNAAAVQSSATIRHRVWADSHAGAVEVGNKALFM